MLCCRLSILGSSTAEHSRVVADQGLQGALTRGSPHSLQAMHNYYHERCANNHKGVEHELRCTAGTSQHNSAELLGLSWQPLPHARMPRPPERAALLPASLPCMLMPLRCSKQSTEHYEGARRKVAGFVNAPRPEEVVFTRNATEASRRRRHGQRGRAADSAGVCSGVC